MTSRVDWDSHYYRSDNTIEYSIGNRKEGPFLVLNFDPEVGPIKWYLTVYLGHKDPAESRRLLSSKSFSGGQEGSNQSLP